MCLHFIYPGITKREWVALHKNSLPQEKFKLFMISDEGISVSFTLVAARQGI